ncbi:hypothetical protein EV1_030419 [Malus domestica]
MRDSTGREWRFTYVCWRNGMTVMYVLEGLNGYQWRAGDKVAFHRIVSEGKLQIRTIKAASSDPPALAKKWQINRAFDNKETEGTIYQIDMLRFPGLHH